MKNILPLLADFANGIFATLITTNLFGVEPTWHYLVGIFFTFLPDLDMLFVKNGDHRSGLHFPIIFIVVGTVLVFYSAFWGTLFLLAVMLHFVNDMYGTGWGVPLFWPFSKKRLKLYGTKENVLIRGDGDCSPVMPLTTWTEEELPYYEEKFGNPNWIEDTYLHLTWISVTQYCLFGVAIMLVLLEVYF